MSCMWVEETERGDEQSPPSGAQVRMLEALHTLPHTSSCMALKSRNRFVSLIYLNTRKSYTEEGIVSSLVSANNSRPGRPRLVPVTEH